MRQELFVARRKADWELAEKVLSLSGQHFKPVAGTFPSLFRRLSQDLNTARAQAYDPVIIEKLDQLVLACHQKLYGTRAWSPARLFRFLVSDFPRTLRTHWKSFAAATIIFYGLAALSAGLVLSQPESAWDFMPPSQLETMENMYDPDAEHYLEPREASGDADMFGFYIYNNISIAFRTFAGGVLAGIGSLFFLALNGVSFGVVAGHLVNAGFQDSFFPFVIAHGSFELTAIVISAQAGLLLGWSAFVTRGLSRSESFRRAAKPALTLIGGAAVMLVAAAVLEAFWSSRHEFPLNLRYASGAACWLFVAAYLGLGGRGGKRGKAKGGRT